MDDRMDEGEDAQTGGRGKFGISAGICIRVLEFHRETFGSLTFTKFHEISISGRAGNLKFHDVLINALQATFWTGTNPHHFMNGGGNGSDRPS